MQKFKFKNSFKKRKKQITSDLANVFQNTSKGRREGSLHLKENLISKPTGNKILRFTTEFRFLYTIINLSIKKII